MDRSDLIKGLRGSRAGGKGVHVCPIPLSPSCMYRKLGSATNTWEYPDTEHRIPAISPCTHPTLRADRGSQQGDWPLSAAGMASRCNLNESALPQGLCFHICEMGANLWPASHRSKAASHPCPRSLGPGLWSVKVTWPLLLQGQGLRCHCPCCSEQVSWTGMLTKCHAGPRCMDHAPPAPGAVSA